MSLEIDLFDYLAADPTLGALVGSADPDGARIYPKRLPQLPEYPSITYQLISAPRMAYTHDNATDTPPAGTVLVRKRIQFDLWAAKDTDGAYEELLPVEAALVAALSGFRGQMGGTFVQKVVIDDGADGFEPDTGSNRRRVDALLTYEEG